MADATYGPLVYMMQGGNELVVASSGLITMESGGQIVWPASGTTASESGSTTLTKLGASGVSFITSSGDTRKFYIGYPVAGAHKWIYATAGSTGMVQYFAASTAASPDVGFLSTAASSTAHMLVREATTSHGLAGHVHLVGLSTSRWLVLDRVPSTSWIAVSTSS